MSELELPTSVATYIARKPYEGNTVTIVASDYQPVGNSPPNTENLLIDTITITANYFPTDNGNPGRGIYTITIGNATPSDPYTLTIDDNLVGKINDVTASSYRTNFTTTNTGTYYPPNALYAIANATRNTVDVIKTKFLMYTYNLQILTFGGPIGPGAPMWVTVELVVPLSGIVGGDNVSTASNFPLIPLQPSNILSIQKCNTGKCPTQNKVCDNIRIPDINILGQTLVDGSDSGDMIFTITDEIYHYRPHRNENDNSCRTRYIKPSEVKVTQIRQYETILVSVVRGKGNTMFKKAQNLNSKLKLGIDDFTFRDNLIYYGMVRYILSYLLYGKFDVNFLLQTYYRQFLADLQTSRFCGFLIVFEDCNNNPIYGYDKYFKVK